MPGPVAPSVGEAPARPRPHKLKLPPSGGTLPGEHARLLPADSEAERERKAARSRECQVGWVGQRACKKGAPAGTTGPQGGFAALRARRPRRVAAGCGPGPRRPGLTGRRGAGPEPAAFAPVTPTPRAGNLAGPKGRLYQYVKTSFACLGRREGLARNGGQPGAGITDSGRVI